MDITLVTANPDKVREAEQILNMTLKKASIDLDEIQELDAEKIAHHKALQAWGKLKKPLFVMDQSIYIDCLNGFPGPLIKWFWSQVTLQKICEIAAHFKNNKIYTETILTLHDGKEIKHFTGRIDGTIPPEPRGDRGWGWDPIFIPEGFTQTYAEMDRAKVTDLRSHRIALEKLRDYLKKSS
jgi:XTP/dITP diphosphohydrolase